MYKLCSLKDIVPGSVIELPKAYQASEGEKAVVLGLEYSSNKQNIGMEVLRQTNNGLQMLALPAGKEDMQFAVTDDRVLTNNSIQAFVTNKIALPSLGMSVGCDPEIFCEHGDGSIFPAWEYMPDEEEARKTSKAWLAHAKWNSIDSLICPHNVPAYWDGAQAEFAPWAKTCLEVLHHGTREGLKSVLDFARRKDQRAKLTLRNVIELPEAVLKGTDDKFIQFRCSQSFNVYNDPGELVQDARQYKYRCAGGHIHVGFTRAFTAPGIEQIVRGLDAVLGVAGVSLAAGIDNPIRRHTYGRAGEFRLPSYGVEYRVLSNFWLSHPAIAMLVFDLARATVRFAESGLFNLCWIADEQETRDVINNCDVDGARNILKRNAAVLCGILHGTWTLRPSRPETSLDRMRTVALRTIMNGIGSVVDPFEIEKNWKIDDPADWQHHCRGRRDNWQSFAEEAK